jgi:hypothetical protein
VDQSSACGQGSFQASKGVDAKKIIITGNPVREGVMSSDRTFIAHSTWCMARACVFVFRRKFGSPAHQRGNRRFDGAYEKKGDVHHIHCNGAKDYSAFSDLLKARGVSPNQSAA